MSEIREGLMYSTQHYWVELENDNVARVGLTDFGQELLGSVTGVTLPTEGESIDAETSVGEIEAADATEELISPISGTVIEVNEELSDSPSVINDEPYGDGWLYIVDLTDPDELNDLMDEDAYGEFLEAEGEDE
ncbi:MAG: glycine cleavage system protein GcvH [Chrysiogenetes bacterium]|nr:glycine cleavage system protein GcvH [Chrysiogenetes bacterium]